MTSHDTPVGMQARSNGGRMGAYRPADPLDGRDARSLADLVKELRDETTTLMRQEIALAKTELSEQAAKAARNAAYAGAGAVAAYTGAIFLLVGVSFILTWALIAMGLDRYVAYWLAPLVVGLVVAGVGGALIYKAITAFREPSKFMPHETIDSLQENTQWAKQKLTA